MLTEKVNYVTGEKMEKFLALPSGKRDAILNAALYHFARYGYHKASMSDIAGSAKVSKSLLFHYFGSKKMLYLYLYEYCNKVVNEVIAAYAVAGERDFFARIRLYQWIKISIMRRYVDLFDFLSSANFERDGEVVDALDSLIEENRGKGLSTLLIDLDYAQFAEDIDCQMVLNITLWCAEGQLAKLKKSGQLHLEAGIEEFECYLHLLRKYFYQKS